MTSPTRSDGPSPPEADALDRMLDRLAAGVDAAHPPAASIRDALRIDVPAETADRHLAMIHAEGAGVAVLPVRRPRRSRRRMLVAALAAAMLLALGSGTAFAAAQDALPGDALYGLKRASERIALVIPRSGEAKAALHLKFAERRLAEIDALAAQGEDVSDLAKDFAASLASAGSTDSRDVIARLLQRTEEHIAHLNQILDRAPEPAREGLEKAIQNTERQQDRVEQRQEEKEQRKNEKNERKPDDKGRPSTKPAPSPRGKSPGKSGSK